MQQAIKNVGLGKLVKAVVKHGVATQDALIATLKRAPVEELRKVNNCVTAFGLYLFTKYPDAEEMGDKEFMADDERNLATAMIFAARILGGAPACDLSELIEEAPEAAPYVPKVGDKVQDTMGGEPFFPAGAVGTVVELCDDGTTLVDYSDCPEAETDFEGSKKWRSANQNLSLVV